MSVRPEYEFQALEPLETPDLNAYWTYEDAIKYPPNQVWTIIEGDEDSSLYAAPGIHVVNRLGFMVTKYPWTDPDVDYYWYEAEGT
jgi:hypothetical protein